MWRKIEKDSPHPARYMVGIMGLGAAPLSLTERLFECLGEGQVDGFCFYNLGLGSIDQVFRKL